MKPKIIHTFGDSHSKRGWQSIRLDNYVINIHHIGAKLMYSFGRDKLRCLNINNSNIGNDDIIVFCFGEIDCRCHINKYVHSGLDNVVNQLVDNYFDAISLNVRDRTNKIVVYSITPPMWRDNIENDYRMNVQQPFLGSDYERLLYTKKMNNKLKLSCEKYGYHFMDVYNEHADENGFLRFEVSDAGVHIDLPTYLEEYIVENF